MEEPKFARNFIGTVLPALIVIWFCWGKEQSLFYPLCVCVASESGQTSDCLVKLSKPEQNVFVARALSSCVVKNVLFFTAIIFYLARNLSTTKHKDAKKVTDPWKDDEAGQFCIFSCKPRPLSVGNVCCLSNVEYSKHISLAEVEY